MQSRPWRSFFIGVAVFLTLGVASIALLSAPLPPLKVIGWLLFGLIWSRLLIGAAGMAQLIAARIRDQSPNVSPFAGLVYGATILGVAMFFPAVGWFFLAPLAGLFALGGGVAALHRGLSSRSSAPAVPPAEPIVAWEEAEAIR